MENFINLFQNKVIFTEDSHDPNILKAIRKIIEEMEPCLKRSLSLARIDRQLGEFIEALKILEEINYEKDDYFITEKFSLYVDILFYYRINMGRDLKNTYKTYIEKIESILADIQKVKISLLPYIYFTKAKYYWCIGDYERAEESIINAYEKEKNNPDILRFLGLINYKLQKEYQSLFDEANVIVLNAFQNKENLSYKMFYEYTNNSFCYLLSEDFTFCKIYDGSWWMIPKISEGDDKPFRFDSDPLEEFNDIYHSSIQNCEHRHVGYLTYGSMEHSYPIFMDHSKRYWTCCKKYFRDHGDYNTCFCTSYENQ